MSRRPRRTYRICTPCETAWVGDTACWICGRPPTVEWSAPEHHIVAMASRIAVAAQRAQGAVR